MLSDIEQTREEYAAIIDLPHPVSKRHSPMPMEKRAAQFAPFAALTGFEGAIADTADKTMGQVDMGYYASLLEMENDEMDYSETI